MKLKNSLNLFLISLLLLALTSCGVYSLSGANVEGKTIQINYIENQAALVAPQLSNILTEKIRTKTLSQTSLQPANTDKADYVLKGKITNYAVSIASLQSTEVVAKNRLTITVEINFENKINPKNSFTSSFDKFADFRGDQTLQSVEAGLLPSISSELADAIFNKAFLNW